MENVAKMVDPMVNFKEMISGYANFMRNPILLVKNDTLIFDQCVRDLSFKWKCYITFCHYPYTSHSLVLEDLYSEPHMLFLHEETPIVSFFMSK